MGFIKLTNHHGRPVYVNMALVSYISTSNGETILDIVGWDTVMTVKESPDAIMALMELKERGKNA